MDEREWLKLFGRNLDRLMTEKGYNMRELAEVSGVGRRNIWGYINGKNWPSLYAAVQLAGALDISVDDLACLNLSTKEMKI